MIGEIRIASLPRAVSFIDAGWPTHIVSLIDHPDLMTTSGSNHLVLVFDDVEASVPNGPQPEHARTILDFTKDLTSTDRLLVHCHMGMRRSPATALAVLVQHGMNVEDALATCHSMRPIMMPNRVLAGHFDYALEQAGAFEHAVREWVESRENQSGLLTDPEMFAEWCDLRDFLRASRSA